jgi:short-subunit dehydrogenase
MNAIVTGATKGIGRALVFGLLREGWNVAVTSRHQEDLDQMKKEAIEKFPGKEMIIHAIDFSKKSNTIEYGQTMLHLWPEIDLLVNNVGIFFPGEVHTEEDEILEKTIDLNLYSPYHLTRIILPSMIKRKKGHIINLCSIASFMAYPNGGAYTISKFALLGFSKSLREEMKPHGIKVTSVMPGATWSGSWEGANFPEDRLMPPEDIAEMILSSTRLSPASCVEEILIRPQLGDL